MSKSMQNSEAVIGFLRTLADIMDGWHEAMEAMLTQNQRASKQLEAFKDLNLTDPKIIEELPKMFSSEQIAILLNVLLRLSEYGAKFGPLAEERMQEFEYMRELIIGTRINLHKLLGDDV